MKAYRFVKAVGLGLEILRENPALLLWGNKDFASKVPELERFKAAFSNQSFRSLDASHFWQGELASNYINNWIKNKQPL